MRTLRAPSYQSNSSTADAVSRFHCQPHLVPARKTRVQHKDEMLGYTQTKQHLWEVVPVQEAGRTQRIIAITCCISANQPVVLPGPPRVIRPMLVAEGEPTPSFEFEAIDGVDNHDVQVIEVVVALLQVPWPPASPHATGRTSATTAPATRDVAKECGEQRYRRLEQHFLQEELFDVDSVGMAANCACIPSL